MKKVFEYTKKTAMEELSPDQREFMARMMVHEIQKYAMEHDVSEEAVYELYQRGMLGSDRAIG